MINIFKNFRSMECFLVHTMEKNCKVCNAYDHYMETPFYKENIVKKRQYKDYGCCGLLFERSAGQAWDHMRERHDDQFYCKYCDLPCKDAKTLSNHLLTAEHYFEQKIFEGKGTLICCGQVFDDINLFACHFGKIHKDDLRY